ncbi:hypothetical protein [Paenibacillus sp. sgz500958]|uniref:hypothetical protein n=1 Tax=Paenibacillus sp. sgz500958 TaxID=3242475 RepID=UPI0036D3C44B
MNSISNPDVANVFDQYPIAPAYVTAEFKSGSTIRIDRRKFSDTQYAMYYNCQTTLVDTFRTAFPNELRYEGNRAIIFENDDNIPVEELKTCIAWALTYHSAKRTSKRQGVRRS